MNLKESWSTRWPNFKPSEVLSMAGQLVFEDRDILLIQPHFLDFYQGFRHHIDRKFIVNGNGNYFRGYRDWKENKASWRG